MIKNRLDNYLKPLEHGCLTHVESKLYIKGPPCLYNINNSSKGLIIIKMFWIHIIGNH